ncbi:hypothetical protein SNE40_023153 [Patella caerulea]
MYLFFLLLLLMATKLSSALFPGGVRNCTGSQCDNPLRSNLKQIQRLHRIKQHILLALGFQADQPNNKKPPVQSNSTFKNNVSINLSNGSNHDTRAAAIISYSESVGEKKKKRSILQFVINTGSNQTHLEVVSAHLWLLVKKRKSKKNSKTIVLKVFKIQHKHKSQLTYLRTRVKKTRWQKLSLPISLVQELVKPPQGRLQLKIECRRCGRAVKIVLPKRGSKNKTGSQIPPVRTLRHRKMKINGRSRPRPFLVINTLVKNR